MQIWAESGKSALPICNYSQILYQFLTFTQNLKRSRIKKLISQGAGFDVYIKGPPNDNYFIIEGPCLDYFTEKVPQTLSVSPVS